jgi:hypothetical protein
MIMTDVYVNAEIEFPCVSQFKVLASNVPLHYEVSSQADGNHDDIY